MVLVGNNEQMSLAGSTLEPVIYYVEDQVMKLSL